MKKAPTPAALPQFLAQSAKLRVLIARHVDDHYADLPEVASVGPFVLWFRVCQWNARAALYQYCVDIISEQCAEHAGGCSASQARAHLGAFLGKSERQVLRYMRLLPYPALRNVRKRRG